MLPRLCKCYNSPTTQLKVLWRKFAVTASLKVGRQMLSYGKTLLREVRIICVVVLLLSWFYSSPVSMLSHRPLFDHLQYAKMEREGLVRFIT